MDSTLTTMTTISNHRKIPVGTIIRATLLISWAKKIQITKSSIIPLILVALISILNVYVIDSEGTLTEFVQTILFGFPYALIAIACHRIVLLEEDSTEVYKRPLWTMRETQFYLYGLVINLISQPRSDPIIYPPLYNLVVLTIGIYVAARLSVLFPAIAIDKQLGFSRSWRATKGNGFRIAILEIAVSLLTVFAELVILVPVFLIYKTDNLIKLVVPVASYLLLMVLIVSMSLVYQYLVKKQDITI